MEAITYLLKNENGTSDGYYSDINSFTENVLLHAKDSLLPITKDYINFLCTYKLEDIRETEEYLLELISFGVLWRSYAHIALAVHHAPFIALSRMAEWRKKHHGIKPVIDLAKGFLMTLFLFPKIKNSIPIPTLKQVDVVCKWFEATGEFREHALRFIRWRAFWETGEKEELYKIFSAIDEFTIWFEEQSKKELGKYTENVENFLKNRHRHYNWREDRVLCTRSRIEYHLNMVGAELMNRAFKKEFDRTEKKSVLVPGCLRIHSKKECKALKVKEGLKCKGCEPKCRINQLCKMGLKYNFDVYIIPHASDLSLWSPKQGEPIRGIIAAACVPMLVEGGWELKRYNVPAQCVLLDYSGCKKHWHKTGTPTELNIKELKRIINNYDK